MKTFAFIFARGGSKGLPRKNVKPLCGKPLIQYSIELARDVPEIDKVFVSTDDTEIARVASSCGAIVIDRPKELAQDTSAEWLAWRHAIKHVTDQYEPFDCFVSLPATSPLRAVVDVSSAIALKHDSSADMCISVTPASRSPYFNMVSKDSNGLVSLMIEPTGAVFRRQDAPDAYDITTVVYATSPDFVLNHDALFAGKVVAVEVPKDRAVDIDDIYDFMLAESILKNRGYEC